MIWMLSEVFIMLLNKKRQTLHDFIAGTVVIRKTEMSQQETRQTTKEDENLIVSLPRWLVFCAFIGMVIVAISNKSHDDEPKSKPASIKHIDKQKGIEKPIEKKSYRPKIINVNNAPLEELQTLPRISESIALAIIDGRPYSSVDDLIRVYGIGPKTLERIRPFVKTK
jgi:competence protein ComEA